MHLNESIVDDAALIMPGATLIPSFSQREKGAEHGKLVGRLREAIRRLNPALIQSHTLATLRDTLLPKLLSGDLSVADFEKEVLA